MNYNARGDHVTKTERNNRAIAERICANCHNLPYKLTPKFILR